MKIQARKVEALSADPNNVRVHDERNILAIQASLKRFGQQKPIVVDTDGVVRAGNGTLEAAHNLGWKMIAVVETALEDVEATAYAIADNRSSELATWDAGAISQRLTELREKDSELLGAMGFTEKDLAVFVSAYHRGVAAEQDEIPATPETATTQVGDLWLLGNHRFLCGDATEPKDPDRLMEGRSASIIFADPPYGIDLDTDYSKIKGSAKSPSAKGYKYEPVIGDDKPFDRRSIGLGAAEEFWFGADYYRATIPAGGSWHVWEKRPEEYAEVIGNDFELIWSKVPHKRRMLRYRWVGYTARETGEKRAHPTQKPVGLVVSIVEPIKGDLILDPFLGSGTTLIAAEDLGRACYGIEIEPLYVDIAVIRWQNRTGQQATFDGDGQTFAEVAEERLGVVP